MIVYIPNNLKKLLLKIKNKMFYVLYIYNTHYSIWFKINTFYNTHMSYILLAKNDNKKEIIKQFNLFFYMWAYWFIKKIKFKGKGYKYTKQKNKITFLFNHSHITEILFNNTTCIRQKKTKFSLYTNKIETIKNTIKMVVDVRYINKYTKRGLRTNKQWVKKRKGKINITIK